MNTSAWFIAGTDTEIGKTYVTCALLHALRARGQRAVAMKPVAAGTGADGRNDDVTALLAAMDLPLTPQQINPWCFAEAVAPHIAAAAAGVRIDAGTLQQAYAALARQADTVLVEGVGGLLVPLSPGFDAADMACALALPVILVVGMRLGCINHALLTAEAMERRGLHCAGWVANRIDPAMSRFDENLDTLRAALAAPLLGVLPYDPQGGPAAAATHLTLPYETAARAPSTAGH